MKFLIIILFLFIFSSENSLNLYNIKIQKAENEYFYENYNETISELLELKKSTTEYEKLMLNLGNSYLNNHNLKKAYKIYNSLLIKYPNSNYKSLLLHQIGVIYAIWAHEQKGKNNNYIVNAKKYWIKSLILEPKNQQARINLEVINKLGNNYNDVTIENNSNKPKSKPKKENKKKNQTNPIKNQKDSVNHNIQKEEKNGTQQAKISNENGHLNGGKSQMNGSLDENGDQVTKTNIDKQENEKIKWKPNPKTLKKMNLTEEAAMKVLNELNAEELQYLQKINHRPFPSKNPQNTSFY